MARLQHKRGRPSNYRKSLINNPYWEEVKRRVRVRDGHHCVICYELLNLEVHHIAYQVDGESIIGKEQDHLEWLCLVCEKCHTEIHKNFRNKLNPNNKYKINIEQWTTKA